MKDTKSGKRSEQRVWLTYRVARQEKGYEGTLADWHYLLCRLPPGTVDRVGMPRGGVRTLGFGQ